jgi:hypothetical protein
VVPAAMSCGALNVGEDMAGSRLKRGVGEESCVAPGGSEFRVRSRGRWRNRINGSVNRKRS